MNNLFVRWLKSTLKYTLEQAEGTFRRYRVEEKNIITLEDTSNVSTDGFARFKVTVSTIYSFSQEAIFLYLADDALLKNKWCENPTKDYIFNDLWLRNGSYVAVT